MNNQMSSEELGELNSEALLRRLDEAREQARKLGYEWVEAEKAYKDARELLPSVLAEFVRLHMTPGMKAGEGKLRALADRSYQFKVKDMNQLEYAARLKEVEYRGWMESIKALTAISYVRNNELKLHH